MKLRIDNPDDYYLNKPEWTNCDKFIENGGYVGDAWNDTNDFVYYVKRAGASDVEVLPEEDNPEQAYYVRFTMPPYEDKAKWLNILDEIMSHTYWGMIYQTGPEKILVCLGEEI